MNEGLPLSGGTLHNEICPSDLGCYKFVVTRHMTKCYRIFPELPFGSIFPRFGQFWRVFRPNSVQSSTASFTCSGARWRTPSWSGYFGDRAIGEQSNSTPYSNNSWTRFRGADHHRALLGSPQLGNVKAVVHVCHPTNLFAPLECYHFSIGFHGYVPLCIVPFG